MSGGSYPVRGMTPSRHFSDFSRKSGSRDRLQTKDVSAGECMRGIMASGGCRVREMQRRQGFRTPDAHATGILISVVCLCCTYLRQIIAPGSVLAL